MTDTKEEKPKKLTLTNSKLSLSKPLEPVQMAKTFVSSRSNTVVEVKKSKSINNTLSLSKFSGSSSSENEAHTEEFNKRLNILKKAAEEAKSKDSEIKLTGLSKLAEINQAKFNEQEEKELTQTTSIENNKQFLKEDKIHIEKEEIKTSTQVPIKTNFDEEEEVGGKKKAIEGKILPQKPKLEEPKKLRKTDIFNLLDSDGGDEPYKTRSMAALKRAREKEKRKLEQQKQEKIYREVIIPEIISVGELANRMTERVADVIRELMKLGIIATSSQTVDADTAEIIVETFGHTSKRVQESDVENILVEEADIEENLRTRAPVVTVMGHVDHGKTSLLDALKSTNIVSKEAGGITQHIGAYKVNLSDNKSITFIDTPGHEAFTEMRTRGAQATDIVVLVVAADDGIKKQTIEAISHAKAANVPIIVAINKIDKPNANIEKVKNELLSHSLIAEDLGGDTIIVPVSALKKTNLDKLLESILLLAEMLDLKANVNTKASGVVIEARVDKGQGVVATILVKRGTLKIGDLIVAGGVFGRIKRMKSDKNQDLKTAGPSDPLEIYGLSELPQAGDKFNIVQTDKQARDITEYRQRLLKEKKVSITKRSSLEDLFLKATGGGLTKELPIIIKGDVQGSLEAINNSLLKLPDSEIKLKILHNAVGSITETDIALARASHAIILGFNVRANSNAASLAEKEKVDIRYYSIIYNLIDDIKAVMSGMLNPIIREQYIGSVDIRQIFNITKIGKIAGCYVTKGIIKKGAGVRLLRDDVVIHEGKLKTLKRFTEEVKEVREGFECGIAFENYDNIKIGDKVEVFEMIEEKKQLI